MHTPVLKIRKKVLQIQNQKRPCVQIQAIVDEASKEALLADFSEVVLFKRTMLATGIPDRLPQPEPMLFPQLANFVKDEGCPEISVKSILSGQMHQAKEPWEVLCFEWVGKRAFDSLLLMLICATEMGTETEYAPLGNDPLIDEELFAATEPEPEAPPQSEPLTEAA